MGSGRSDSYWKPRGKSKVSYKKWQRASIKQIESDVRKQLSSKPQRLAHSISVARTSERLACLYGVDPYLARVAGLLHDWDKVVPNDELVARAKKLKIDVGVPLGSAMPLLHGMVAARELPKRYPKLPKEVWHAIGCHTSAAKDMGPLDMVLFVADGIEPLRRPSKGIQETRDMVGKAPLEDVFWNAFVGGIVYVLQGGRYLLPRTIDIYNSLARERARRGRS